MTMHVDHVDHVDPADILEDVADVLRTDGWCQHTHEW
jgi:hypothetical protein